MPALLRVLTLATAAATLMGCAGPLGRYSPLASVEDSLVFHPAKYPAGAWQPQDLAFEDAWFASADGTRLHGWYLAQPRPRAAVLYCHGNAGNLTNWQEEFRILHRLNLSVLAFDYRGYGRSEGEPDGAGILADARAARRWLAERAGIAETDVVLMGRSLGGAVAVDLAARDGARALILESTFTSLPDVVAAHTWLIPARWLMRNPLNSLAIIGEYRGPLLISHGDADRLIPFEQSRELFEGAAGRKTFYTVRGGDHNDPQPPEYYAVVDRFLDQLNDRASIAPAGPSGS